MQQKASRLCSQIIREMKAFPDKPNSQLVKKSFEFCVKAHVHQKRISGGPYWTHPANAALTLAKLGADSETVAAALLHDTIEDTPITESDVKKKFGREITELVKGVTKLDRISQKGSEQHYQATNIQKIMLASAKDLRVMAIKLADKLHNLQTLKYLPKKDQIRIASQILTVFVPLAHKLGIHDLKHELEDLAFSFVSKKKYNQIKTKVNRRQKAKTKQLKKMIQQLKKTIKETPVKYRLRHKGVLSQYARMNERGKTLSDTRDCTVLIMETNSVTDCYKALGGLHNSFLPVPNKVKDYIAIPQPNLYQALHSTVISPNGEPTKVYISTQKMIRFYHRGILALDSTLTKADTFLVKERLKQLNKLFNLPYHFKETEEFMSALTQESLSKSIFIFTPKGDIIELPFGSTPLDFAFKIRPSLGKCTWRVRVNGQFVGMDKRLENGNIVEIIPSRIIQVQKRWLEMANTVRARKTIMRLLRQKKFQKNRSIDVSIIAKDRAGLLSEITYVFETEKINIACTYMSGDQKKRAFGQFNIPPISDETLKHTIKRLRHIKGIMNVHFERA
ncbi:HD domain-containing protein [Candidatus Micrarchaeota archaeon]|nr:HD domain-containing protein [Candidatus Micrarchaeota archaeon]MBU1930341.1 HD domain-containing protein [Candidatus Micrarchaeota archaeon]